ncbi:MAG: phosphotransferase, partial [Candidatus Thorarchaeota archaeon]
MRSAKDIVVERIAGLTNKNYRVIADGNQYALRISRENAEKLGINREFEFEALKAASEAGIAPEVVCFIRPEGHLITQWIDGRHWTYEEYQKPENIHLMVQTIKRLHSLPAVAATFSPF